MNIAMLVPFDLGAATSNRALALAQGLSARGHLVRLLVAPQHEYRLYTTPVRLVGGVTVARARYITLPGVDTLTRSLTASMSALHHTLTQGTEIVYSFDPLPTTVFAGYLASKIKSLPWVLDAGDYAAAYTKGLNLFKRRATVETERFAHRNATASVVVSHFLVRKAREFGARIISLLPNGVDLALFEEKRSRARKKKGRIVYVGTLKRFVDLEDLLHAFRIVQTREKGAELEIVGEGEGKRPMIELAKVLGIEKRVHFSGFLPHEQAVEHMAEAEVAVLPLQDNEMNRARCSVKLLEYLASGLPVVANDVGEVPYILSRDAGIRVTPGDTDDLAHGLATLLQDRHLRERMGEKAVEIASAYDWRKLARRLEEIYSRVISN